MLCTSITPGCCFLFHPTPVIHGRMVQIYVILSQTFKNLCSMGRLILSMAISNSNFDVTKVYLHFCLCLTWPFEHGSFLFLKFQADLHSLNWENFWGTRAKAQHCTCHMIDFRYIAISCFYEVIIWIIIFFGVENLNNYIAILTISLNITDNTY